MYHTMTRFTNGIINVMLAAYISIVKVVLESDKLLEMVILFFSLGNEAILPLFIRKFLMVAFAGQDLIIMYVNISLFRKS